MKTIFSLVLVLTTIFANAQSNSLRIDPTILLPKDSIESNNLTTSLEAFLCLAQHPTEINNYVYDKERIETMLLLDEIIGIEKSGKYKDDNFYKPYLTNAVLQKDSTYLIQVSYIGTTDGKALLRASFKFIAYKTDNTFTFSSPLLKNSDNWKELKVENNIFHYKNTINETTVEKYNKWASFYDLKLKSTHKITDFYCTENLTELLELIGVDYKMDYNGRTQSTTSATLGDRKIVVLGNNNANFDEFDSHDLFHDRLSLIVPRSAVNRSVDEGCAYLYAGSWGFTWEEVFKAFMEQIASDRTTNWVEIKETPHNFTTGRYPNSADYIVNALLVRKIEQEKGFEGVWELLKTGPAEKGNVKYYQKLEELTGITKENYNEKIWELINDEI